MDLRRTLVVRLTLSFVVLVLMFSAVWLRDLRKDAFAEQAAASRLVDLLLADNGPSAESRVANVLAQGELRHVKATLQRSGEMLPASQPSGWLNLLGLSTDAVHEHRIPLGNQVLLIRPDPESELREKLGVSVQVLVMLLVFCAACLGMVH